MENGMCLKNDIVCHKKASNKCNECNQFLAMQALTAISNNMPLNSLFFVLFVNIFLCSAKPNVFLVETNPSTKTSIKDMEGPSQRNGNFC